MRAVAVMRDLHRRLKGATATDPLMPHAAELLLADLEPQDRRRIWRDAALHAGRTRRPVELLIETLACLAVGLLLSGLPNLVPLPYFMRGRAASTLWWVSFSTIFYSISSSILGMRRAIRYVRNELTNLGRCPSCGYDLRATPDRCPECGAVPAGKATT